MQQKRPSRGFNLSETYDRITMCYEPHEDSLPIPRRIYFQTVSKNRNVREAYCEVMMRRKRLSCLGLSALIGYIAFIFCSTVFFREMQKKCKFDLHPFWSYKAILNGRDDLVAENIMNVVLFVPVGLLLGVAFTEIRWKTVLLIGLCLSLGIETLQFVYSKGFTEFDDVMHNTLGCVIGYGVCTLARYWYDRNRMKSLEA